MNIQNVQNHPAYAPEKIQQTKKTETPAENRQDAPRYDEYVPEEAAEQQSIGIYRMGPDEDGNPRAVFDAPGDSPEPKTERCTANTDNVDREIEKLKEERKRLSEQLQRTDDPQKAAELRQKLSQLENELQQKDNDAYRRQHTVFS